MVTVPADIALTEPRPEEMEAMVLLLLLHVPPVGVELSVPVPPMQ